MGFMEQQVTTKQTWIEVETSHGTVYLDAPVLGLFVRNSDPVTHPLTDKERESIIAQLSEYCEGTIQSWSTIKGYGARLSAPGYMDCTEWSVFGTAEEAQQYLDEYYPEDEDEDEVSA